MYEESLTLKPGIQYAAHGKYLIASRKFEANFVKSTWEYAWQFFLEHTALLRCYFVSLVLL